MRALVTGATGLLGSHLLRSADEADEIHFSRFDIKDRDSVRMAMCYFKPETIIHCAAEGRVDFAQENYQAAFDVNVSGTQNLLMSAKQYKAHFVFISSNAVFEGNKPPYHEYSVQSPVNRYGWTKRDAEDMVEDYEHRSTIIRPIMLYGWPTHGSRGNFVTRCIEDLKAGKQVLAAVDIFSQPTYALDCAQAIWAIIKNESREARTVNIAPKEKMSLYKFACEVALTFEQDPKLVIPVNASELKGLAPRPLDTTYDVSRLERLGLTMKPPIHGLLNMKKERP